MKIKEIFNEISEIENKQTQLDSQKAVIEVELNSKKDIVEDKIKNKIIKCFSDDKDVNVNIFHLKNSSVVLNVKYYDYYDLTYRTIDNDILINRSESTVLSKINTIFNIIKEVIENE